MESIDLVERLIPDPSHTLVIETPTGELVLVDTERIAASPGDTVLRDDDLKPYETGDNVSGVAYCSIRFL